MKFYPGSIKLAFLFLLLNFLFNACSQEEPDDVQVQQYYYYPKTNIYFDAQASSYIYTLDSGRSWQRMKKPDNTPAAVILGAQIALPGTDKEVWLDNEAHRNQYGGMLLNVITKDTALLNKESVKSKEVKKKTEGSDTATETATEPGRKKNLFQRIFGKKKKNNP